MNDVVWVNPVTGNLAEAFEGILCTRGFNREIQVLSTTIAMAFWAWRYPHLPELSIVAAEGMRVVSRAQPASCACKTLAYRNRGEAIRASAWFNTLAECNELRLDTEVYACGDMWHCRAKPWDGGSVH